MSRSSPLLTHNSISPCLTQAHPKLKCSLGVQWKKEGTQSTIGLWFPLDYGVQYSLSLPQGVRGCPQHCNPRNLTAEGAEAP